MMVMEEFHKIQAPTSQAWTLSLHFSFTMAMMDIMWAFEACLRFNRKYFYTALIHK